MNLNLKHALVDQQVPAYRIAMNVGIRPDKVSKIVSGIVVPTDEEKNSYRKC